LFFPSPINAINSNQLDILILIVIVLLLWGVVIDKIKVVVVVKGTGSCGSDT
jgi:TRAP-type C4-dicarboxylate transport system permease large subunit